MLPALDDTIVAISSPPGAGRRGVVRLSGPDAITLAGGVFISDSVADLKDMPGHRRVVGRLALADSGWLPAEALVFRAPASYTRQDLVELHTLGAPAVLGLLVDALVEGGARQAGPGEFTARAFMNGTLDLARAQGVAALIHATQDAQCRAAQALLTGELSRQVAADRDELADLLALIEAQIDFSDEPVGGLEQEAWRSQVAAMASALELRLRSAVSLERVDVMPHVVLTGLPNAGKSTLFNQLAGVDRVIPSPMAGTTRDVVAMVCEVPGGEVMLHDSAGLTASWDGAFADADGPHAAVAADLDGQAQAAAQSALRRADLAVWVVDASDPAAVKKLVEDCGTVHGLIAANKMDRPGASRGAELLAERWGERVIRLCGLTGQGVDVLSEAIGRWAVEQTPAQAAEALALSGQQREAMDQAARALRRAESLADRVGNSDHLELLALELREAMHALSLLTGEVATEELLGRIFSRFCIGK